MKGKIGIGKAIVIVAGMALIGFVCWLTESAVPLFGVIFFGLFFFDF